MAGVLSEPLYVSTRQGIGHRRIGTPATLFHVGKGDLRLPAHRVISVLVHPEYGVEDLQRRVRVESGRDLRQYVQVPVDEAAQTVVVVYRAAARRARHEQLVSRNAERILAVHEQETDPGIVVGRMIDAMRLRPGLRLRRTVGVVHAPDFTGPGAVEV